MKIIFVTIRLKLFIEVLGLFAAINIATAQALQLKITSADTLHLEVIETIGYTKTFEEFTSLETQVSSFTAQLYQLGYIEAQVLEISTDRPSVVATIALGPKYERILLYADNDLFSFLELESRNDLENKTYYGVDVSDLESILNKLTALLTSKSHPFASVSLKNISPINKTTLSANLVVEKKQPRQLQSVEIKGYEKFPRSFIKQYLGIKTNTPFDLKAIRSKTETLNQLNFTNQLRPAEVLFTQDTTRVYLYLEKTKSNRFDGFLGFGSDETSGDLEINGYLNLNLVNNLNFGESFRLNYRSDENDLKTFETQLTLPYLFKSPIGSELQLNIIKKDSTFTTAEQAASLYYQINPKQKVFFGIKSSQSNALTTEIINTIEDYRTSAYELRYMYQQRNPQNILVPLKRFFEVRLSKATRKTTDTKTNQTVYTLNASNVFSLNLKNSVYVRLNAQGINSESYLQNELLRFGGINAIRGFEENSISATQFGILASEYRYQLSPTLYMHSIIDAAYFKTPIQSDQKLFGFGFGFGLLTEAGLLKFNLANGKTETQSFKFSDSKVHLSLTATF
ncbi:MAG: hypothetical protein P8P55_08555 [Flavobacteriaceae bacterium]|jgi:translocation and assembly module TamA|nr:hypothetical protein [Flavobacteriaceae bacterium]